MDKFIAKSFLISISIFSFSTSVLAQNTKEKRVCNVLENGTEFCTIFKVHSENEVIKNKNDINKEVEEKLEIILSKAEEGNKINKKSNYKIKEENNLKSNKEEFTQKLVISKNTKNKEDTQQIEKKELIDKVLDEKKIKEESNKKTRPSLKDKQNFANFLSTIKELE